MHDEAPDELSEVDALKLENLALREQVIAANREIIINRYGINPSTDHVEGRRIIRGTKLSAV